MEIAVVGLSGSQKEMIQYTLENQKGSRITLLNYGGIISSFKVRLPDGNVQDIVLGFDDPTRYLGDHPYFGAIIGRYANRIARGRFELQGNSYVLARNNENNHLHGGTAGFDKVFWEGEVVDLEDGEGVCLSYTSKDGEEGYPGTLTVKVFFFLTTDNELRLVYRGVTDKPTIVNLTHHDYFNLGVHGTPVYQHEMRFFADRYLEVDETLIPTGKQVPVTHTPFDFLAFKPVGKDIQKVSPGYDHCYVISNPGKGNIAVEVKNPSNGLLLQMRTSQPGFQFYTGNFLDGTLKGKGEVSYQKHTAFCLEAQHFPDAPNHPEFPATLLLPGEVYHQETIYRISNYL